MDTDLTRRVEGVVRARFPVGAIGNMKFIKVD
jgi:hypothetical protein